MTDLEPAPSSQPKTGTDELSSAPLPTLVARAGFGGALMGAANLVPGISGGTMLLAAGVFPQFVRAVSDLTRLRFEKRSILLLGTIVVAAALVIGIFAGVISGLVLAHTWAMYSIFIGLTLGGVPLIWRMAGVKTVSFRVSAAIGWFVMIGIAWMQMRGADGGGANDGFPLLFLAGIAGASAMVLPGVSGGYLLLLMGVYVPILEGIEQAFTAVRTLDVGMAVGPAFQIILPVGCGVALGVAGVSNVVKIVLERFPKATLGLLLGLLLGAVVGLWPFQRGVEPEIGTVLKGQTIVQREGVLLYERTGSPVEVRDYPREFFRPAGGQIVGSIGLILIGFGITAAVARIGGSD